MCLGALCDYFLLQGEKHDDSGDESMKTKGVFFKIERLGFGEDAFIDGAYAMLRLSDVIDEHKSEALRVSVDRPCHFYISSNRDRVLLTDVDTKCTATTLDQISLDLVDGDDGDVVNVDDARKTRKMSLVMGVEGMELDRC